MERFTEKMLFFEPKDFADVIEMPLGDLATEICNRIHDLLERRGFTEFLKRHTAKLDRAAQVREAFAKSLQDVRDKKRKQHFKKDRKFMW